MDEIECDLNNNCCENESKMEKKLVSDKFAIQKEEKLEFRGIRFLTITSEELDHDWVVAYFNNFFGLNEKGADKFTLENKTFFSTDGTKKLDFSFSTNKFLFLTFRCFNQDTTKLVDYLKFMKGIEQLSEKDIDQILFSSKLTTDKTEKQQVNPFKLKFLLEFKKHKNIQLDDPAFEQLEDLVIRIRFLPIDQESSPTTTVRKAKTKNIQKANKQLSAKKTISKTTAVEKESEKSVVKKPKDIAQAKTTNVKQKNFSLSGSLQETYEKKFESLFSKWIEHEFQEHEDEEEDFDNVFWQCISALYHADVSFQGIKFIDQDTNRFTFINTESLLNLGSKQLKDFIIDFCSVDEETIISSFEIKFYKKLHKQQNQYFCQITFVIDTE